jgi:hypothetical protein
MDLFLFFSQFQSLMLDMLELKFYNFFYLFFMKSSWFHDKKVTGLIYYPNWFDLFFGFFILFFNIRMVEN